MDTLRPTEDVPTTGETSAEARRRLRWEPWVAALLILGTILLLARNRRVADRISQQDLRYVEAQQKIYRERTATLIRWGAKAPDFSAVDSKGHRYRLGDLLRGCRYLVLAFVGGRPTDAGPNVEDLMDLERLYKGRGLRIIGFMESPSNSGSVGIAVVTSRCSGR